MENKKKVEDMTREKAFLLFNSKMYQFRSCIDKRFIIAEMRDVLKEIYNNFENRSCESCKYYINERCKNENSYCENTHIISDVFYCSEWDNK